jgi:hypothetical protein
MIDDGLNIEETQMYWDAMADLYERLTRERAAAAGRSIPTIDDFVLEFFPDEVRPYVQRVDGRYSRTGAITPEGEELCRWHDSQGR